MAKKGKQLYNLYDIYLLILFSTAFTVIPSFVSLAYLIDLNKLFNLSTLIYIGLIVDLVVLLAYYYWITKNKRTLQRKVKPQYTQEFFIFELEIVLGIIGITILYFIAGLNLIVFLFVGLLLFISILAIARWVGIDRFNMKF